jgi:hypothetical protein
VLLRSVGLLGAVLIVATPVAATDTVPWRTARTGDSVEMPGAVWESWEVRAIDPRGRRALVLRFWTKANSHYLEWLVYERGRKPARASDRVEHRPDNRPGVRMIFPSGRASLSLQPGRWRVETSGPLRGRASFAVSDARPGVTIGPLQVGTRRGRLSVVATGRADGTFVFAQRRFRLRGWHAVVLHEWADWQLYGGGAWVRRDLALLWTARHQLTAIWGLEESRSGDQVLRPNDALWRGVVAHVGMRPRVCVATIAHGPVIAGTSGTVVPTRGFRAGCRTRISAGWRSNGEYGWGPWVFHTTFTGLGAWRSAVGFVDQTVPST